MTRGATAQDEGAQHGDGGAHVRDSFRNSVHHPLPDSFVFRPSSHAPSRNTTVTGAPAANWMTGWYCSARRMSDKDQDPVRRAQAHRAAPPEALCHELRIAHRGEPESAPAHAPAPQITAHRTAQHLVERAGVEQPLEGGIDDGAGGWHGGEHRGAHPTPTTPFATCSPAPTDAESQPNGACAPETKRRVRRRAARA